MLTAKFQAIIAAVLLAIGFFSGWTIQGWRHDSIELVAQKAVSAQTEARAKDAALIASSVEAKLAELKTTERIIDRGIIKEIRTNEVVYSRECFTDAGRVLINSIAKGAPASKPNAALPK